MNGGNMRRGRKQVLQLDDNNETTVLARKGKVVHVDSSTKSQPGGLSALGDYSDSDSNNSDVEETNDNNGEEPVSTSSIVDIKVDTKVDNDVNSFLSEVNSISASTSPSRSREGSATPPPLPQQSKPKPNLYKSMFVKGATEWNKKKKTTDEPSSTELDELPDEPTTLWQICVDENTQFQYYWHTVSNEVTWTIPSDYTQYLLQYKLYEEQLAKIPLERREYLLKKKMGLITSPKILKPTEQPKPPTHQRESSPTPDITGNVIGPSLPENKNGGDPPLNVSLSEPEKQFYSEIEELEKMDIDPPEEPSEELPPLPPLPPMPPPPDPETSKTNGKKSEAETSEKVYEAEVDLDDIDVALETALQQKQEELKKLEDEEKHSHKKQRHHHKSKRQSSPDSSHQYTKRRREIEPSPPPEKPSLDSVVPVRKVMMDYEHDTIVDDGTRMANRSRRNSPDVENLVDVEEVKDVLESKLEFLSISKKGLTKLQILLVELQTRYVDYLSGALQKEYFRKKLLKLESQINEYEKSAVPAGWTCRWDRTFRCYAYSNEVTGDTVWEHPDSGVQVVGETTRRHRHRSSSQSKSRSSKSHSSKRSKDKRKEDKKSKSKSSRRERKNSSSPEVSHKSSKSHGKIDLTAIVDNISMGGLMSKSREPRPAESITILDDDEDEVMQTSRASKASTPSPPSPKPEPLKDANAYDAATSDEEEAPAPPPEPASKETSDVESAEPVMPSGVIFKPPTYNNSEVSTSSVDSSGTSTSNVQLSASTSSVVSSSTLFTSAPPPPPPDPPASPPSSSSKDNGEAVSSSDNKGDDSAAKESKKKKKDKNITNTNFSLKKKKVSSLVNKWKQVKMEVEKEEKIDEERQLAIRQKLEEWKKEPY